MPNHPPDIYTTADFDPLTAGATTWTAYARLCAGNAANPPDLHTFQRVTIENFARKHTRCRLLNHGAAPVLAIRYQPAEIPVIDFVGKTQDIEPLIPHISSAIAEFLQQQTPTATFFLTTTKDPGIQQLLTILQGTVTNEIQYFQLDKDLANLQKTDRWLDNDEITGAPATGIPTTGIPAAPTLTVTLHNYVPPHLYEPVAVLMTELMNDIIRDDNQQKFAETAAGLAQKMNFFRETGVSMPLLLLSDLHDQLVGMSFVLVSPGSIIARQELTGVIRKYRDKKLAYYLKARAIHETFHRYPQIEIMETNCYSANRPIIHINEALGYMLKESALQFRVPYPPRALAAPHAPPAPGIPPASSSASRL
jgi:hypothetical protein